MSSSKTYVFRVEMTCEGCTKAIANVLNKHKDQGISSFNIDLQNKKVTIQSAKSIDVVSEILKKTGKKIELLEEKQ